MCLCACARGRRAAGAALASRPLLSSAACWRCAGRGAARPRGCVPSPLDSRVRARSASLTIHARTRDIERKEGYEHRDSGLCTTTTTVHISSFLLEQMTVRMHGHGEDDNVLGKSQWTPVGHAAQRRTCRRSSQGRLRALHRQQAEALLADEALLGEFVIGREAGRVRGFRRPAVRSLFLRNEQMCA